MDLSITWFCNAAYIAQIPNEADASHFEIQCNYHPRMQSSPLWVKNWEYLHNAHTPAGEKKILCFVPPPLPLFFLIPGDFVRKKHKSCSHRYVRVKTRICFYGRAQLFLPLSRKQCQKLNYSREKGGGDREEKRTECMQENISITIIQCWESKRIGRRKEKQRFTFKSHSRIRDREYGNRIPITQTSRHHFCLNTVGSPEKVQR